MAKYTIELRALINEGYNIFNFNYNFYNDSYKKGFEEKFIKHFYFREIGAETVPRFMHNLECKLSEIYPYYEHLYRTTIYEYDPILNYNVTEEIKRQLDETSKGTTKGSSSSTTSANGTNNQYDTPITPRATYEKTPSFIDNNISEGQSSSTGNEERNNINNLAETNTRKMSGNIGVMTTQDLIMKERQIIINIDKMILDECEDLFMQIF